MYAPLVSFFVAFGYGNLAVNCKVDAVFGCVSVNLKSVVCCGNLFAENSDFTKLNKVDAVTVKVTSDSYVNTDVTCSRSAEINANSFLAEACVAAFVATVE